jgi:hypothetical protein
MGFKTSIDILPTSPNAVCREAEILPVMTTPIALFPLQILYFDLQMVRILYIKSIQTPAHTYMDDLRWTQSRKGIIEVESFALPSALISISELLTHKRCLDEGTKFYTYQPVVKMNLVNTIHHFSENCLAFRDIFVLDFGLVGEIFTFHLGGTSLVGESMSIEIKVAKMVTDICDRFLVSVTENYICLSLVGGIFRQIDQYLERFFDPV